jgi:hypothetical protein
VAWGVSGILVESAGSNDWKQGAKIGVYTTKDNSLKPMRGKDCGIWNRVYHVLDIHSDRSSLAENHHKE